MSDTCTIIDITLQLSIKEGPTPIDPGLRSFKHLSWVTGSVPWLARHLHELRSTRTDEIDLIMGNTLGVLWILDVHRNKKKLAKR